MSKAAAAPALSRRWLPRLTALAALMLATVPPAHAQAPADKQERRAAAERLSPQELRQLYTGLALTTGFRDFCCWPAWFEYDDLWARPAILAFQIKNLEPMDPKPDGVPTPALLKRLLAGSQRTQDMIPFNSVTSQGLAFEYAPSLFTDVATTPGGLVLTSPGWQVSLEVSLLPPDGRGFAHQFADMLKSGTLGTPDFIRVASVPGADEYEARAVSLQGTREQRITYLYYLRAPDGSARGLILRLGQDLAKAKDTTHRSVIAVLAVTMATLHLTEEAPVSKGSSP